MGLAGRFSPNAAGCIIGVEECVERGPLRKIGEGILRSSLSGIWGAEAKLVHRKPASPCNKT